MKLHSASDISVPVLIVGGGLAGLSSALFLAWRGIPCMLVEKHPGSSPHPRAVGYTTRTLELLRAIGIEDRIPQISGALGRPRRVKVASLAGRWSEELSWNDAFKPAGAGAARSELSPCGAAFVPQDRMESILREAAIERGADIRLSTLLQSFDQDADGVCASLRTPQGDVYRVRADYLIAADGHASPVREALGIARSGHGFMQNVSSVFFRAELDEYLQSGISQFEFDQPDLRGMLTTMRDGRWLMMISEGQHLDNAALREKLVRAIGREDRPLEIIAVGHWELGAHVADRFAQGRVFLAGDAAHALPPARGGYGANTAIEDSFNLAWKLASVLSGPSSPALLDTYDAERRPIAWLRHDQILARRDYADWATEAEKQVAVIEDDAMELGQLYRSASVVGARSDMPPALHPEQWAGQPGTRAPHLWVTAGGKQRSTLDLLQRGWTLVAEDKRWCQAAQHAGAQLGMELNCLRFVGAQEADPQTVSPPTLGVEQLTVDCRIEQIAAEPGGRAALEKFLPEILTHGSYAHFKTMSLRQLQPVSQGAITDALLAEVASRLAVVTCQPVPVDAEVFKAGFRAAFGLGPECASLIRPDGYVAWRSCDKRALRAALSQVASAAGQSVPGQTPLAPATLLNPSTR